MSDLKLEGALDLVSDLASAKIERTSGTWMLPSYQYLVMHELRPADKRLQALAAPLLDSSDSFGVINLWAKETGCDYATVKLMWGSSPTRACQPWLKADFNCPRPDSVTGTMLTLYQQERDPVKRMALQYIHYSRAERLLKPAPDLRSWPTTCNLLSGWVTDPHPRQYLRSLLVPNPLTQREFDRLVGYPLNSRDFARLQRVVGTLAASPAHALPYVIKMLEDEIR